jgi:glycosidase
MKKSTIVLLTLIVFISCKTEKKEGEQVVKETENKIAAVSSEMIECAVIYEANIRQYSPEGTFNAFTKDISQLKELGVKVIWVMPINPISQIKRKATGDMFTSEIEDEEDRKKYLGSYYSVSDYKAINPEFGTKADFQNLVDTAHKNGIYVIIDWVPNHTGWDHPWITAHPEWYTQNEKGEIIDPINPDTGKSWGWTDTADLNYDSEAMRKEMIIDMKYWVVKHNIDGFRVDVAHKVPVDFFNTAITELKIIKPLFMLAEAELPDLLQNGFDMHYGWEVHHILNDISKGEKTVKAFDAYMDKNKAALEADDINMNFLTNHDENSWGGTIKERMPDSKETFTALTYVMPGMPLIYSGQEYDLDFRLKFFEKDEIPKTKGPYFEVLKKLGKLKNTNPALHTGKQAASYSRIATNNKNVLVFKRSKNGNVVTFIANLSKKEQTINNILEGKFLDYMSNTKVEFKEKIISLKPWEYKILVE